MIEYPILKSILTEDFAEFTSCVPCQQDCGLNYCSIRCRDLDFFESHNYTCVGPHNDDHPLVMFKENAIDYADTFFLAAQAIACIANKALKLGDDIGEDKKLEFVKEQMKELTSYCNGLWNEVADLVDDDEDEEGGDLRVRILNEQFELLKKAWLKENNYFSPMFETSEFMSRLMGAFERNNISVEVRSPMASVFRAMMESSKSIPALIYEGGKKNKYPSKNSTTKNKSIIPTTNINSNNVIISACCDDHLNHHHTKSNLNTIANSPSGNQSNHMQCLAPNPQKRPSTTNNNTSVTSCSQQPSPSLASLPPVPPPSPWIFPVSAVSEPVAETATTSMPGMLPPHPCELTSFGKDDDAFYLPEALMHYPITSSVTNATEDTPEPSKNKTDSSNFESVGRRSALVFGILNYLQHAAEAKGLSLEEIQEATMEAVQQEMIELLRMKEVSFRMDWSAEAEGDGVEDDDDSDNDESNCCSDSDCHENHSHNNSHSKKKKKDNEKKDSCCRSSEDDHDDDCSSCWGDETDDEDEKNQCEEEEDELLKLVRISEEVQKLDWKSLIPQKWPNLHGTGFFSTVSLTNHSCDPNISYDFLSARNVVTMVASRDIKAGEEFLMSYLSVDDMTEGVEIRREVLQEWGFLCTCSKCQAEAKELKKKKNRKNN